MGLRRKENCVKSETDNVIENLESIVKGNEDIQERRAVIKYVLSIFYRSTTVSPQEADVPVVVVVLSRSTSKDGGVAGPNLTGELDVLFLDSRVRPVLDIIVGPCRSHRTDLYPRILPVDGSKATCSSRERTRHCLGS